MHHRYTMQPGTPILMFAALLVLGVTATSSVAAGLRGIVIFALVALVAVLVAVAMPKRAEPR